MTTSQLKNIILEAFVNVKLGDGTTLRQSKVQSNYGEGYEEYRALMQTEIRDNWREIPFEELRKGEMSFFDAAAFRYYIPAYMVASLEHEGIFATFLLDIIFHLYPKKDTQDSWDYRMRQYSLLNEKQNQSVALYIAEMPVIFPLESYEKKEVSRALRNYWGQFLPKPKEQAS